GDRERRAAHRTRIRVRARDARLHGILSGRCVSAGDADGGHVVSLGARPRDRHRRRRPHDRQSTAVPLERAAGHGVAVGRYDILDRRTRRGRPRRSRVPRWSLRFPAASLLAAARWYRAVGPTHTTRDRWLSRSHVGAVCDVALSFLLLQAHFASRGVSGDQATMLAGAWAFGFIAIGAVGCVLAGAWADRIGRETVAALAMVVSGACALAVGWLVGSSTWALVAVGLVWGF